MKIMVANELERKIVKEFIEYLSDYDIDCLPELERYNLDSTDKEFLTNGFNDAHVEIGETHDMQISDENITGICVKCGASTNGLIDGESVNMEEYESITSDGSREDWLCLTCSEAE